MVNTAWVNAGHGRDFHPPADHMTKFQNFTKEENRDFSAFRFSLQLMLEQVCLMILQKQHTKVAQTS